MAFVALGQGALGWRGMAAAPNGDVYAAAYNGDIYKQTGGSGAFTGLGQTARLWAKAGMAAAPNGDVYATTQTPGTGDIYKQTGGVGDFIALGLTGPTYRGMTVAPNGDVYAASTTDIYKQTGGIGAFNALGQAARQYYGMAAAPNGDIYAVVDSGDIYMQTGGTGDFNALGQTARTWRGIAADPDGNIYACSNNPAGVYIQTGGVGDFITLGVAGVSFLDGAAAAPNGDVYVASGTAVTGDIYEQNASPPTAPTLLTAQCSTGIGESTLPEAPLASFTVDQSSGLAPLTVVCTDRSTNTPTSWSWSDESGVLSTAQNPTLVFALGTHTLRLTATNAQGSSQYQATIIAYETPVVAPPTDGTVIPAGPIGNIGWFSVDTAGNAVKIHGTNGAVLRSQGKAGGQPGDGEGEFFQPTTCAVINGRQGIDRVTINEE